MSLSDGIKRVASPTADIHAVIESGRTNEIDRAEVQGLLAAAVRLYATKADAEGYFPIVPPGAITATDAMIVSSALLRAVNIAVFELGLWQSWAGATEEGRQ